MSPPVTATPPPHTPARRRLRQHCEGVVMIEFLLAFFPIFLMFLGLVQLSLLFVARMVVQHAAVTGARAAIVVLDDEPVHYGGTPRGCLVGSGGGGGLSRLNDLADRIRQLTGMAAGRGAGRDVVLDQAAQVRSGGPRMAAIYRAGMLPLLSIAPALDQVWGQSSVHRALGADSDLGRLATGIAYNLGATAVTVPEAPGAQNLRTSVGTHDAVTVRVTHLFPCSVPVVSALMCDSVAELMTAIPITAIKNAVRELRQGEWNLSTLRQKYDTLQRHRRIVIGARQALQRSHPAMDELAAAPVPALQLLAFLHGGRFRVYQAEATLVNQGASYRYSSQGEPQRDEASCEDLLAAQQQGER
ncbi:MAG: TadE/TadG family type IV pilus assembly protein [Polyangiales bacterium]